MTGEPQNLQADVGQQRDASEQLYRRIFETSPAAMLVVDPDTEAVLEANAAVAELYGTTREKLVGVPYYKLTGDLDRGLEPSLYGVAPGTRVVTPADHKRADGTLLDLEIAATPIDHHGTPALLCTLRPAPKAAPGPSLPVPRADASDLVKGFIAEVGSLLNHMRGYADELMVQIAGLHGDPVGARELGDHIGRGDLLVRQLRVLDGHEVPMPETFDLNEVIGAADVFLSPVLRPDIQLVLEPGSGEVELYADRTQVEMAVACLVASSVNAMPDGGRVVVRSGALTSELGWFAVEDEGAPIQQDSLPLLYEPFQDPSLLGRRTGLELAAFKRVIDGLGGEVEVTSGAYRGMSILVMLPRAR
ncbi:MAG: PAS domain S-box protein [Thermoanaerobaculaceae bacterium]